LQQALNTTPMTHLAPTMAGVNAACLSYYPALASVQPAIDTLALHTSYFSIPAGHVLFEENTSCLGFPLLLEGEIKVSRSSGDGRSIELYRLVPGDICLISSACLFRSQPLSGRAISTRPSVLRLIDASHFSQWLNNAAFRDNILGLFAERLSDLTALVDAVAFARLDQRLANALLGRGSEISVTHQALAEELGTVREIVTRLLKRFEREGWITLARERIGITNSAALRARAAGL